MFSNLPFQVEPIQKQNFGLLHSLLASFVRCEFQQESGDTNFACVAIHPFAPRLLEDSYLQFGIEEKLSFELESLQLCQNDETSNPNESPLNASIIELTRDLNQTSLQFNNYKEEILSQLDKFYGIEQTQKRR